jgi:hypothetical protein
MEPLKAAMMTTSHEIPDDVVERPANNTKGLDPLIPAAAKRPTFNEFSDTVAKSAMGNLNVHVAVSADADVSGVLQAQALPYSTMAPFDTSMTSLLSMDMFTSPIDGNFTPVPN